MVFDALCLKTKTEIQINNTCLQIVFPLKKIQKKKERTHVYRQLLETDRGTKESWQHRQQISISIKYA